MENNFEYNAPDLAYIVDLTEGETELINALLDTILQSLHEIPPQMATYFIQNQYDMLAKLAHKLKSSVTHLNIVALNGVLNALETLKDDPNAVSAEKLPPLMKHLQLLAEQTKHDLKQIRG